jgi:hypothetical protein
MAGEKTQSAGPGEIRFGAMLAGMLLCLLISMGLPYGEFVIQGTRLGLSSSTPAAFFLLFVLVAFASGGLRGQRHLDHGQCVVQHLPRVDD